MASLVVLECNLWLNLTDIKDTDHVALLDSPVSPGGLFGSVVDGFTQRFTEAQKSSQAMHYFLPKRAGPSTDTSRSKLPPQQQRLPHRQGPSREWSPI